MSFKNSPREMNAAERAGDPSREHREPEHRRKGEAEPDGQPLRGAEEEHDEGGKAERAQEVGLSARRPSHPEGGAHDERADGGDGEPANGDIRRRDEHGGDKRKTAQRARRKRDGTVQNADMESGNGEDMGDPRPADRREDPVVHAA